MTEKKKAPVDRLRGKTEIELKKLAEDYGSGFVNECFHACETTEDIKSTILFLTEATAHQMAKLHATEIMNKLFERGKTQAVCEETANAMAADVGILVADITKYHIDNFFKGNFDRQDVKVKGRPL
jgi:3-dehydroquinate synthase class II